MGLTDGLHSHVSADHHRIFVDNLGSIQLSARWTPAYGSDRKQQQTVQNPKPDVMLHGTSISTNEHLMADQRISKPQSRNCHAQQHKDGCKK